MISVLLKTSARAGRAHLRNDRGSSTAEVVVVLPVLMLVITVALQFALWALASSALSESAAQGGAALRSYGGTAVAGRSAALLGLGVLANGLVVAPEVSVGAPGESFDSLSESGTVVPLLPGEHLTVSAQSTGPKQQFRASG